MSKASFRNHRLFLIPVEGAAEVTESNEADGAGSGHVEGSAEASGDSNKEKRNDHEVNTPFSIVSCL